MTRPFAVRGRSLTLLLVVLLFPACSTIYYSAWEAVGVEKRDLLRSNVETVREDQEDVSEQFESTLERIRALYGLDGTALEKQYDRVATEYERSEADAEALRDRIDTVEEVASDLFAEWTTEIDEISDANLKQRSREQLSQTRARFAKLSSALSSTEASLAPVLQRFKDQVLFLKHSLNAQAVGQLEAEGQAIEGEVDRLLRDLRTSIQQTDLFIRALPE